MHTFFLTLKFYANQIFLKQIMGMTEFKTNTGREYFEEIANNERKKY